MISVLLTFPTNWSDYLEENYVSFLEELEKMMFYAWYKKNFIQNEKTSGTENYLTREPSKVKPSVLDHSYAFW